MEHLFSEGSVGKAVYFERDSRFSFCRTYAVYTMPVPALGLLIAPYIRCLVYRSKGATQAGGLQWLQPPSSIAITAVYLSHYPRRLRGCHQRQTSSKPQQLQTAWRDEGAQRAFRPLAPEVLTHQAHAGKPLLEGGGLRALELRLRGAAGGAQRGW